MPERYKRIRLKASIFADYDAFERKDSYSKS
jgi:hypothetical protein